MQQRTACLTCTKRFKEDMLITGVKTSIKVKQNQDRESALGNQSLKFSQMIGAQSDEDYVLTLKTKLIKRISS